jgi:hypothetical protein
MKTEFNWYANKYCVIQGLICLIFGIMAGFCFVLEKEYLSAGGIFLSLGITFLIFSLGWAVYPREELEKRRNLLRIFLFLISHMFVYLFIEGGKCISLICKTNHLDKSVDSISKTFDALFNLWKAVVDLSKSEYPNFEVISWVYLILLIGFCISCYKFIRSWSWPCVICISLVIALSIVLIRNWELLNNPWNWCCLVAVLFSLIFGIYFGKQSCV